jgi:thiol-disulfide isomerase/thioredoxin
MAWAATLFGPELLTKEGFKTVVKPTVAALADVKFVALYFSAHWCGPCKRFTPAFATYYEDQGGAKDTEVVFVTLDHDDDSFLEYFAEMPWAAVPFAFEGREAISDKFGVVRRDCTFIGWLRRRWQHADNLSPPSPPPHPHPPLPPIPSIRRAFRA